MQIIHHDPRVCTDNKNNCLLANNTFFFFSFPGRTKGPFLLKYSQWGDRNARQTINEYDTYVTFLKVALSYKSSIRWQFFAAKFWMANCCMANCFKRSKRLSIVQNVRLVVFQKCKNPTCERWNYDHCSFMRLTMDKDSSELERSESDLRRSISLKDKSGKS